MTLTIAPEDAALQAIVDRVNAGSAGDTAAYQLDEPAQGHRVKIDLLEQIKGLRVDVCHLKSKQLKDLTANENTSHTLKVYLRKPMVDEAEEIPGLSLLLRKIFLQLDNFDTDDGTVSVWDCDNDEKETPIKSRLKDSNMFIGIINLRVEVTR